MMMGTKGNREQLFLGSASDEVCDYMICINEELNLQRRRTRFSIDERAAIRAQYFLQFRIEVLKHCNKMRKDGHYNHPSTYVVEQLESEIGADGKPIENTVSQQVTVLLRERYFHGRIQKSVYGAAIKQLKNLIIFGMCPCFDSGFYGWDDKRINRYILFDEQFECYKCEIDMKKRTYADQSATNTTVAWRRKKMYEQALDKWTKTGGKQPQNDEETEIVWNTISDMERKCFEKSEIVMDTYREVLDKWIHTETGGTNIHDTRAMNLRMQVILKEQDCYCPRFS
ncbi:MAG: hypothetical protein GY738_25320, partial [Pseudoalteromonas sp.]|nr:hypothetical protein [Pseudoalteromonas sp.]